MIKELAGKREVREKNYIKPYPKPLRDQRLGVGIMDVSHYVSEVLDYELMNREQIFIDELKLEEEIDQLTLFRKNSGVVNSYRHWGYFYDFEWSIVNRMWDPTRTKWFTQMVIPEYERAKFDQRWKYNSQIYRDLAHIRYETKKVYPLLRGFQFSKLKELGLKEQRANLYQQLQLKENWVSVKLKNISQDYKKKIIIEKFFSTKFLEENNADSNFLDINKISVSDLNSGLLMQYWINSFLLQQHQLSMYLLSTKQKYNLVEKNFRKTSNFLIHNHMDRVLNKKFVEELLLRFYFQRELSNKWVESMYYPFYYITLKEKLYHHDLYNRYSVLKKKSTLLGDFDSVTRERFPMQDNWVKHKKKPFGYQSAKFNPLIRIHQRFCTIINLPLWDYETAVEEIIDDDIFSGRYKTRFRQTLRTESYIYSNIGKFAWRIIEQVRPTPEMFNIVDHTRRLVVWVRSRLTRPFVKIIRERRDKEQERKPYRILKRNLNDENALNLIKSERSFEKALSLRKKDVVFVTELRKARFRRTDRNPLFGYHIFKYHVGIPQKRLFHLWKIRHAIELSDIFKGDLLVQRDGSLVRAFFYARRRPKFINKDRILEKIYLESIKKQYMTLGMHPVNQTFKTKKDLALFARLNNCVKLESEPYAADFVKHGASALHDRKFYIDKFHGYRFGNHLENYTGRISPMRLMALYKKKVFYMGFGMENLFHMPSFKSRRIPQNMLYETFMRNTFLETPSNVLPSTNKGIKHRSWCNYKTSTEVVTTTRVFEQWVMDVTELSTAGTNTVLLAGLFFLVGIAIVVYEVGKLTYRTYCGYKKAEKERLKERREEALRKKYRR